MNTKSKNVAAIVVSLLFVAAGIYIGAKHYKEQGFWYGVLALMFLGTYVAADNGDYSFRIGAPAYNEQ